MEPFNPSSGVRSRPGNQLTKAAIVNTVTGTSLFVMFNPDELTLEQGNTFAEVGIPGLNSPPVQYVRGKARTLSMELFFDTYEINDDVRNHTAPIVALLDKEPRTQAPPVLLFTMGSFQFRCVLVDAGQRFTMFMADGTPVRSKLTVRLQEYVEIDLEIRQGLFVGSPTASAVVNALSPLPLPGPGRSARSAAANVHTTAVGDTLSGLAAHYLGDPARWREIADANSIEDPRDLPPGLSLVVPVPASGRGSR